ncbi:Longin-like domain-containing protein [Coniella lustricola]|uniref:Trafficking protein particle complex subunit n=1 Tax=Coniella lustricola TaxID=2025994 RepID=A0A2T3AE52_9PEZI|nr:Longin-like domain-containing protein [Coniella lustricola]
MAVFSFYIFDRHTECVYTKSWLAPSQAALPSTRAQNDAKLIFGTVFSLRNIVRKLGGEDDAFISFRTGQYRLHYYETPTNLRFVLLTDTATMSMRNVLHQIYINLWVEYGKGFSGRHGGSKTGKDMKRYRWLTRRCDIVIKNPLAPVEHKGGEGVKNELFEMGLDQFIRGLQ